MKVNLLKQVCDFSLLYIGFCDVLLSEVPVWSSV